jgi:hypothetical protein
MDRLFTTYECEPDNTRFATLLALQSSDIDTTKTTLNVDRLKYMTEKAIRLLVYPKEVYFNPLEYNYYRLRESERVHRWWKESPEVHYFHLSPLSEALYSIQYNFIKLTYYPGFLPIFYNNMIPLFLVILSIIFIKRNPATAIFCIILLIQFVSMFLVSGLNRNFRYIYFLYFSAVFILPLWYMEIKNKLSK